MLPVVIGGVALAIVGYGVKKYIDDEDFKWEVDDKIYNGIAGSVDGLTWLEEKMGLDPFEEHNRRIDEALESIETSTTETIGEVLLPKKTQIDNLFEYKLLIKNYLKDKFNLSICKKDEIRKEYISDMTLDTKMIMNIKNYQYLIKAIYEKIVELKEKNQDEDISLYSNILKRLFTTKIIKKSKLNKKSNQVIIETMQIINN